MTNDELLNAQQCMKALLAELPYEFTRVEPGSKPDREMFQVIKRSNVRTVHEALWELQILLGMKEA